MGTTRRQRRTVEAADGAPAGVVTGLGSDRGRFSEEVESEIAEVRGRMRSLRRVGSVRSGSGDSTSPTDGGNGASGGIAGSVGGKGVFQSFRESLFPRAAPELASPPASVQTGSGTGGGIVSGIGTGAGIDAGRGSGGAGAQETAVASSTPDENRRKLRTLMERVRLEMEPFQLEQALGGFEGVAAHCRVLCGALVGFEAKRREELHAKMRGSGAPGGGSEGAGAAGGLVAQEELVRALEKAPGLMEVREWRQTVAALRDELSRITGHGSGPASLGPGARAPAPAGADDGTYLERERRVTEELGRLTQLLEFPAASIPPAAQEPDASRHSDPTTRDFDISKRGNAILEFPVLDDARDPATPAPRKVTFRVSSHILSEASPAFADLFAKSDPEPPRRGPAPPGRPRATAHRMAPLRAGQIRPLEILLHAAHAHTDRIPRSIPFEELVSVAEVCLRFECTAPLELFVEMCWLPEWMAMGTEAVPGGLLLVSYAFGMRGWFTRMTKSVVLNVVSEEELGAAWPVELRERIWAVRRAKMEQIYACCVAAVQEYLRSPKEPADAGGRPTSIWDDDDDDESASAHGQAGSQSLFPYLSSTPPAQSRDRPFLTSTPRCPKGSHECDAANLGYFLLVLSELQLLPVVMNPGALSGASATLPPRSLAQLVRALQRVPGPANPVHRGGVCDPVPAFRRAVMDIFNSLEGLTLFDVTGRHGYGLSRRFEGTPQRVLGRSVGSEGRAGLGVEGGEGREVPGEVALGILRGAGAVGDLRALALVSRGFYEVYKRNESALLGRLKGLGGDDGSCPEQELEVMTEEEARRIIWPDSPGETPPAYRETREEPPEVPALELGAAASEGSTEKFRVEDALFGEGKVLSVMETKQLTAEHDVYVGMHRDKVEAEAG